MTPTATRTLPPLGPMRALPSIEPVETTLSTGLRVMVVRQPTVPLAHIRLRVPFAGDVVDVPLTTVLSETMLSGTSSRDNLQIAADLQGLGAGIGVATNADKLLLSGSTLATGLESFLSLMADVVTDAQYPAREVSVEVGHLADTIEMALARPSTVAHKALIKQLFGNHPYGVDLPNPEEVTAVTPEQIRELHAARVHPAGSTLIVVGDVVPSDVFAMSEKAFPAWSRSGIVPQQTAPQPWLPSPTILVDRPGSVQSTVRMAFKAVDRTHTDYAALRLANFIFGGYFSSRLVLKLREDKGYAYRASSSIQHTACTSTLYADADVATEVTAPALLEMDYELGRLATTGVTPEEVDDVRRYATGVLTLSLATQGGLASTLENLVGVDLEPSWLSEHVDALQKVTVEDVSVAAAKYLSPMSSMRVVVGDAETTRDSVAKIVATELL